MTEKKVAMTGECFGIAGHRKICAKVEWLLTEDSGGCVIYCYQDTSMVRGCDEFGKITDIKSWITRSF